MGVRRPKRGPVAGQADVYPQASRSTAPADVAEPLTEAIAQLSVAVDTSSKGKGLELRPEYYVQHLERGTPVKSLDHSKMSTEELIFGMVSVLEHLIENGGEWGDYAKHLNFVCRQVMERTFVAAAFVGYDRMVVDKFMKGHSATFVEGDTVAAASNFHAGHFKNAFRSRMRRPDLAKRPDDTREDAVLSRMPEDWPEEVCFNWNTRSCYGKCLKLHVCAKCRYRHKVGQCRVGPSRFSSN